MVKYVTKNEAVQACMTSIHYNNLQNKIGNRKYAKLVKTVEVGYKNGSIESVWKSIKKHKQHLNRRNYNELKKNIREFFYRPKYSTKRTFSKKWSPQECYEKHLENMKYFDNMEDMLRLKGVIRSNFLPQDILKNVKQHVEALYTDIRVEDRKPFAARGRENNFNRRDALWFGMPEEDGYLPHYRAKSTSYSNPTVKISKDDATKAMTPEMIKWMKPVTDRMEDISGHKINHFVIHRYVGGDDTIGLHHDKTQDLSDGSTIFCLSLGDTRRFRISAEPEKDKWGENIEKAIFKVKENDIACLTWDINQVYRHAILPGKKKYNGVRYSITARSKCTLFNKQTNEQKIINTKL